MSVISFGNNAFPKYVYTIIILKSTFPCGDVYICNFNHKKNKKINGAYITLGHVFY